MGEKSQKIETLVGKLECTKRGIERDKKTLRKFRLPFPSASRGDFASEKPSVSPNMARRKCAHKAASCRNKDRNLCPYGRKALNANKKKAPLRASSSMVTPKIRRKPVNKKDKRHGEMWAVHKRLRLAVE